MKRWIAGLLGSALMLAASGAQAGQVWNTLEFKVQPGQAGAVAKAVGDFQKTEVAQDRTATVTFYRILFNGVSPATHSITVLWPSRMENETSSAKMNASSEFQEHHGEHLLFRRRGLQQFEPDPEGLGHGRRIKTRCGRAFF